MVIKEGRYGPYVTDGETNASLRKGDTVEDLSAERAAELLAERRASGGSKKPGGRAKKTAAAKKTAGAAKKTRKGPAKKQG